MVYFTWEHSNEEEHEDEARYSKDEHKNPPHETSNHMFSLMIYLADLSVCFLYIRCLQVTDFIEHALVLLKLFLEALGYILHPRDHLKHILFKTLTFFRLIALYFIVVDPNLTATRLFVLSLLNASLL